jgi:uncharacterized phage protein (possible DNA packaging)
MSAVSVPELKAQLNLDHDFDDALLALKIDAAEAYAASFIGTAIPEPIPAAIRQAVLMLSAHWYETREAAMVGGSAYVVPFGVHDLLQAHRAWVV